MTMSQIGNCSIDFEKFHTALRDVNLLDCRGSVVRVSGLVVESIFAVIGGCWPKL